LYASLSLLFLLPSAPPSALRELTPTPSSRQCGGFLADAWLDRPEPDPYSGALTPSQRKVSGICMRPVSPPHHSLCISLHARTLRFCHPLSLPPSSAGTRPKPPRRLTVAHTALVPQYLDAITRVWGDWALFQQLLTVLRQVGDRHGGASIANIAVRWVLDHPFVGAVLVGTSKKLGSLHFRFTSKLTTRTASLPSLLSFLNRHTSRCFGTS
jgi:hypothetical protein